MPKILVTGGTGTLGKRLCSLLSSRGIPFTVGSRRTGSDQLNVAVMDLLSGAGVAEAVADKEVILHLASDLKRDAEVTRNLIKPLASRNDIHLVLISIVGVDRVPLHYYRQKLESENTVTESGVPFTILRATQFHEFIDRVFSGLLKYPIAGLPKKAISQPIQTEVVAAELLRLSLGGPTYAISEIGGPEPLTFEQIAAAWLQHTGKKRWIINVPMWGKFGRALCSGGLATTVRSSESIRWEEWLQAKYASSTFAKT